MNTRELNRIWNFIILYFQKIPILNKNKRTLTEKCKELRSLEDRFDWLYRTQRLNDETIRKMADIKLRIIEIQNE